MFPIEVICLLCVGGNYSGACILRWSFLYPEEGTSSSNYIFILQSQNLLKGNMIQACYDMLGWLWNVFILKMLVWIWTVFLLKTWTYHDISQYTRNPNPIKIIKVFVLKYFWAGSFVLMQTQKINGIYFQ